MQLLLIIGLPKQLQRRLEAAAGRRVTIKAVQVDTGREGTPMLLPHPTQVVHLVRQWGDHLGDDALLLVLPYAPIPEDVQGEVGAMEELGMIVRRVLSGEEAWPQFPTKGLDSEFLNKLFTPLQQLVTQPGAPAAAPSAHLLALRDHTPNLLIPAGAIDKIDQVASLRFEFMRQAADALAKLASDGGPAGPIEGFFRARGLLHAQTGGIAATLRVRKDATLLHEVTSHVHLKKGDKTTPQAAARLYYHVFVIGDVYYVAILYAGPHPDTDVALDLEL